MLVKFAQQVLAGGSKNAPPHVIRASDLDKNFGLCFPVNIDGNNAPYTVIHASSDQGYTLKGNRVFDVCENGKPVKYLFFAERLPG